MNIEKKGILNKREYLGPVWPADVWPADDIPFCSIFTYFQYSLLHDLALDIHTTTNIQMEHIQYPSKESSDSVVIPDTLMKILGDLASIREF